MIGTTPTKVKCLIGIIRRGIITQMIPVFQQQRHGIIIIPRVRPWQSPTALPQYSLADTLLLLHRQLVRIAQRGKARKESRAQSRPAINAGERIERHATPQPAPQQAVEGLRRSRIRFPQRTDRGGQILLLCVPFGDLDAERRGLRDGRLDHASGLGDHDF